MELSEPNNSIEGLENRLADFHAKRKNYYRMEILKQKYLDNWLSIHQISLHKLLSGSVIWKCHLEVSYSV